MEIIQITQDDLTLTSLQIVVRRGNYPKMGGLFTHNVGLEERKIGSRTFHIVELFSLIYLTNELSMYDVSMYLCIYASMHLCIYASMHLCIYASMHLCIYVSMYLSTYLSTYLPTYLSIYLFIYLSISVSLSLYPIISYPILSNPVQSYPIYPTQFNPI